MLILEIMIAIILTVVLVAFVIGLLWGAVIVIFRIKNAIDDSQYEKQREKFPDYYEKLDVYNEKFAEASRFQLENIDNKKIEIDKLLNEIKYLPTIHTTVQLRKIEDLKEEIYENGWTYKKMSEECEALNSELIKLRQEYNIR